MNKFRLTCIVMIFVSMIGSYAISHATTLNIGAHVWYANWDYYQKEFYSYRIYPHSSIMSRYRMPWGALYGPHLSVDFAKKWSLSNTFMYSDQFRISSKYIALYRPDVLRIHHFDFTKYDLDSIIRYSIFTYLKVFVGFKFQGYSIKGKSDSLSPGYAARSAQRHDIIAPGAGAGIGTSIPVYENLFLLASVSSVFLRKISEKKWDHILVPSTLSGAYPGTGRSKAYYDAYGAASSISLAYYVERADLTFSLGFRHQSLYHFIRKLYFTSYYTSSSALENIEIIARTRSEIRRSIHRAWDHFYGVYFSAVYSIHFTKNDSGG